MEQKKVSPLFKLVKGGIQIVYPRMEIIGAENIPEGPCLIISNHAQMNGPIACELYFPGKRYTWCAGEMMHLKDVPAYAYRDFWSQKPAWSRWFYRILSYMIAPLSVLIFNNANTIAVHRDARIMSTFRTTLNALTDGARVVIFPEYDEKYNHIIYNFQDGFVDIARLYRKKTGMELQFVPMYIAPGLKQMHIGKPIEFDSGKPLKDEKARICRYLMDQITEIACALPRHRVIPYRNIPKKDYPWNLPER